MVQYVRRRLPLLAQRRAPYGRRYVETAMMSEAPALRVKRLRDGARLPLRATAGASGLDLFACLDAPGWYDLSPDPSAVPTGIAIELPPGYDATIRPRSGLSLRGVGVVLGTIDADYRGELLVSMYVFGTRTSYRIEHGDRIAQLVIAQLANLPIEEASMLSPTPRDTGGHGSTGRR
jgi:dUTP pyrophosphatase